jgi:hypothetical protein
MKNKNKEGPEKSLVKQKKNSSKYVNGNGTDQEMELQIKSFIEVQRT